MRETVVLLVLPPPVPVMVMVLVASFAFLLTLTVIVDVPEPGAAIDDGLKLTDTPAGWPLADSAIAELKPLSGAVVTVYLPELFLATLNEDGDALMLKLALAGMVTVKLTVVV